MKIIHIVPDIGEEANGVATVVNELSVNSISKASQITIATIRTKHKHQGINYYITKKINFLRSFDISFPLMFFTYRKLQENCILHNHGLWSFINIAIALYPLKIRSKLIVSPHGTLSKWSMQHKRFRKKLFWQIQKLLLIRADIIHVTSIEELHEVRDLNIKTPIAVIPNGVRDFGRRTNVKSENTKEILFLSRLHPKKGLDNLISAWMRIENQYPNWHLKICGTGEPSYILELKRKTHEMKSRRIHFLDPLYGAKKTSAYMNADVFILPTYSENFGMVIAEALMNECPVIVGKGAPWSKVAEVGCGWWIENDIETISSTLIDAFSCSDAIRQSMGQKGRKWMKNDFDWNSITHKMILSYEWLSGNTPKPDWIKLR